MEFVHISGMFLFIKPAVPLINIHHLALYGHNIDIYRENLLISTDSATINAGIPRHIRGAFQRNLIVHCHDKYAISARHPLWNININSLVPSSGWQYVILLKLSSAMWLKITLQMIISTVLQWNLSKQTTSLSGLKCEVVFEEEWRPC